MEKEYKVYMHINKADGKRYIGITRQSLKRRWKNGNGYKRTPYFYKAIQKYGWDNFEHILLEDNLTLEEANKKEIALIKEYKTTNRKYGYNISLGGTNGKHSPETIEKLRKYRKEHKIVFSKEALERIANAHRGKTISDTQKEAVRQNMLKNNPMKNESSRKKVGEALKGMFIGEKSVRAKKVLCIETGEVYGSLNEAIRKFNNIHICQVCNGQRNMASGYHWRWLEKEEI